MVNRATSRVGEQVMKGQTPDNEVGAEDALWIITMGMGMGKQQYT